MSSPGEGTAVPAATGEASPVVAAPQSSVRRVIVNSAAHFGSYLLNSALAVVVSVFVIRHLGRAEYGVMAFIVSYLSFFQIFSSLGTDVVLIREASRVPARAAELVGGALTLRLGLSLATLLAAISLAPLVAADHRVVLLVALESLTFLFSFNALYLVGFNIELRSHIPNSALAVWSLAFTALRLGLVALGARVPHFLLADVVSAGVVLWISRQVCLRYSSLRPRFRVDTALWSRLLKEAWPVALAAWLIAAHNRVDQMLLFRMKGPVELGGYSVAVRMSEIWGVLTNVLMVSLFPLLSRDALSDPERMERTTARAYRYLYAVICPVAVAMLFCARPILTLVFGASFADAAPALSVLTFAQVFQFSNAVTYNVLFSMNRQLEAAALAGVSVAINVAINLWLIPGQGATGAAIASLFSYGAVPLLALGLGASRRLALCALGSFARPAAAALLATVAAGLAVRVAGAGAIGALLVVCASYPLALLALGAVQREDRELLARVFSEK